MNLCTQTHGDSSPEIAMYVGGHYARTLFMDPDKHRVIDMLDLGGSSLLGLLGHVKARSTLSIMEDDQ